MPFSLRRLLLFSLFVLVPVAVFVPLMGDRIGAPHLPEPIARDFGAIVERDTLVALTSFNSTSYFLYRGQPMGFEYELLRAFAEEHDLEFRVRVVADQDSLFYYLNEGAGDVVAARVVPAAADTAHIAFTKSIYETVPAVVQRAGPPELPDSVDSVIVEGARAADTSITGIAEAIRGDTTSSRPAEAEDLPEQVTIQARLIQRPADLAGARVHVPGGSPYKATLIELSDSLTGDVAVVELGGDVSHEQLIRRVAGGEVDLTVSPENLAELTAAKFSNIVASPTIGDPHEVAWATRVNAPDLLLALNQWLTRPENEALLATLYRKYFVDRKGYRERAESEYLTGETGRLSPYDDLLRRHAAELGWDWRLLASQTFQESRFQPRARSWAGAAGLLQLMPPTAREFGVTDPYDPEQNVAGAARFIRWLTDYWDDRIPDGGERLKFILASYNTGHGHVEDARRLTAKNGGDDTYWAEVAFWLLQKSNREVYTDPVVRYGFSRGLEPVTYVALILERFEHYRQFVTDAAVEETVASGPRTGTAPKLPPAFGTLPSR